MASASTPRKPDGRGSPRSNWRPASSSGRCRRGRAPTASATRLSAADHFPGATMVGVRAERAYLGGIDNSRREAMAAWTLWRKSTDDTHEPHLPHEDRSTQILGVAVTLGLAAVISLGTLALFA